jgi:hypothetical protein
MWPRWWQDQPTYTQSSRLPGMMLEASHSALPSHSPLCFRSCCSVWQWFDARPSHAGRIRKDALWCMPRETENRHVGIRHAGES